MKKITSLLTMSIPFLCFILANGAAKKHGYDLAASRTALVICSVIIVFYLLIKEIRGSAGYTAIGLSSMMVAGTLNTIFLPPLGQLFLSNVIPSLYLTLFFCAVIPPLLGMNPITHAYSSRGRPPAMVANSAFKSVNRSMTNVLAGVFGLAFIASVLPYSNTLRGAVPLVIILFFLPMMRRLPPYFLKRVGGTGGPGEGLEIVEEGMPPKMRTLPIEETIENENIALSFESVTRLIDENESFLMMDCICRSQEEQQGHRCDKPRDLCIGVSKEPNKFVNFDKSELPLGKGHPITKEEAKDAIKLAEKKALVHMTHNYQEGLYFICSCCGCCCRGLKNIREGNIPASAVVNSNCVAKIDNDLCTMCGVCAKKRCQTAAIEEIDGAYKVMEKNCIGCGLCVPTCPVKAITLERKKGEDFTEPPWDYYEWEAIGEKNKESLT